MWVNIEFSLAFNLNIFMVLMFHNIFLSLLLKPLFKSQQAYNLEPHYPDTSISLNLVIN